MMKLHIEKICSTPLVRDYSDIISSHQDEFAIAIDKMFCFPQIKTYKDTQEDKARKKIYAEALQRSGCYCHVKENSVAVDPVNYFIHKIYLALGAYNLQPALGQDIILAHLHGGISLELTSTGAFGDEFIKEYSETNPGPDHKLNELIYLYLTSHPESINPDTVKMRQSVIDGLYSVSGISISRKKQLEELELKHSIIHNKQLRNIMANILLFGQQIYLFHRFTDVCYTNMQGIQSMINTHGFGGVVLNLTKLCEETCNHFISHPGVISLRKKLKKIVKNKNNKIERLSNDIIDHIQKINYDNIEVCIIGSVNDISLYNQVKDANPFGYTGFEFHKGQKKSIQTRMTKKLKNPNK